MTFRLFGITGLFALATTIQSQPQKTPRFEVSTIKLNPACKTGPMPPGTQSADRWRTECSTVQDLIRSALLVFADGKTPDQRTMRTEIVGGPDWVRSDYYSVEGKAEGRPPILLMLGPMTRTLLEERFHLKVHTETTEAKVYALNLAKNGLRVTRTQDGTCIAMDLNERPAEPTPGQAPPVYCGERLKGSPMLTQLEYKGVSMADFAARLAVRLDRDVIDKTGLTGNFDLQLEFTPDETTPGFGRGGPGLAPGLVGVFPIRPPSATAVAAQDPAGPSILNAIDGLGLKLEPAEGTRQILVIDSVERPTEN